ncbi:integrin alpha-4 [Aplysia californica]|uniref:Integrin alpha-4 n=1 Tax=Aplysia californica TaxID=6500 RepID=A0ABM0JB90_APLCA|nr:integrin alpha-4 [Aplysia californica]
MTFPNVLQCYGLSILPFPFNMKFNKMSPSVLSVFLLSILLMCVHGFNLDLEKARIIPGPAGTLFGFTAKFRKMDLLVGAPKASYRGITSGKMFVCTDILSPQANCSDEVYYDDSKVSPILVFENSTFLEGFASSIAVLPTSETLICSPRWKDTRMVRSNNLMFMPGRCSFQRARRNHDEWSPYFKKGLPSYGFNPSGEFLYFNGLASFGFSSDANENNIFALGAPGVSTFEGSLYIKNIADGTATMKTSLKRNNLKDTAYGYEGYSVKLGKFCNPPEICLATGAPRLNRHGVVSIYKWLDKKKLTVISLIEGTQVWSFFGASLCAVDIDGDGYDELLIGAPQYSDLSDKEDGHDQGRVFIYGRTQSDTKYVYKAALVGGEARFATFGHAIEAVGDLNQDGFQDVAIGAPGENYGEGCVYIYLGTRTGLRQPFSQRLCSSQLPSKARNEIPNGFGFSISNAATSPGDGYPIFAVTSVVKDSVTLIHCRPVVEVTASLKATPNPLKLPCPATSQGCLQVEVHLNFTVRGYSSIKTLDFDIDLAIDTQVSSDLSKRAQFLQGTSVGPTAKREKITIQASGSSVKFGATILEAQVERDRFTPVEIRATYKLADQDSIGGVRPVLDAFKPNNISHIVAFANNCGKNKICEVDLKVNGNVGFSHAEPWDFVVVNYTKQLTVDLEVTNTAETSYWTVFTVTTEPPIIFRRSTSSVKTTCQGDQASLPEGTDKTLATAGQGDRTHSKVSCNYYKPLENGSSIHLTLKFSVDIPEWNKTPIKIKAVVLPNDKRFNPETTPRNNEVNMMANVFIMSNVSVDGSSSPLEQTVFQRKKISLTQLVDVPSEDETSSPSGEILNVTHKVLITNHGPSSLPTTSVFVKVPTYLTDGSKLVVDANVTMTTAAGVTSQCLGTKYFQIGGLQSTQKPSTTTGKATESSSSSSGYSTTTAGITGTTQSGQSTTTTTTIPTTTTTAFLFKPNVNRRKRSADDEAQDDNVDDKSKVLDTTYVMSCELNPEYCYVYECELPHAIPASEYAEINISMSLDKRNVPIPEGFNTLYFLTDVEVQTPSHPLFLSWQFQPKTTTMTKFHLASTSGKINIWIIVGSVAGALVLITVIVLVLKKLGFFKRDRHHQVERWRRESKRRSRVKSQGPSKAE